MPRFALAAAAALLMMLASCEQPSGTFEDLHTRIVVTPSGDKISAEVMATPKDLARGMMFRDSLAKGKGMLFVHQKPQQTPYWMYQVRIPLDIIWIDTKQRIVEIVPNAAPCQTKASQCPTFGGTQPALFVLELPGGDARRLRLNVGDQLSF